MSNSWGYQQDTPQHQGEIFYREGDTFLTVQMDDETVRELRSVIEDYESQWGVVDE